MKVAILGGGESGSGWAARFVLNGHDVRIFAPGDEQDARRTLNEARASLPAIYDRPLPATGGMEFAATMTEAVAEADWVQIVGPDLPENILPHLRDEAIVASSTALHDEPASSGRLIVARPVAPVYLMPVVEIAGPVRAHATMEKASGILRSMGMLPVMRKVDEDLLDPWAVLTASTTPAAGARQRDAILVAMLRALKRQETSAGEAIRAQEMDLPIRQEGNLMVTARRTVPPSWTDANGHMNEAHYVEVASNATDVLTESCGVTADYIASGRSHFTVETHVRYLAELHEGEEITVRSQLLFAEGRKAHVFHYIHGPGDRLAATVEVLLLHVDLASRRVSAPSAPVAAALKTLELTHRGLPRPKDAGNAIRDPRGVAPAVRPEVAQEIATC